MNKTDALEKISKLLNLANNKANDAESATALLMAQKLMAKHGITEDQVSSIAEEGTEPTTVTFCNHPENKGYRSQLAAVIADNFRCRAFMSEGTVMFVGHKTDCVIARKAFEYAYTHIKRNGTRLADEAWKLTGTSKGVFNSYASGYMKGIQNALSMQAKALMIIVPKDVDEFISINIGTTSSYRGGMSQKYAYRDIYSQGVADGEEAFRRRQLS